MIVRVPSITEQDWCNAASAGEWWYYIWSFGKWKSNKNTYQNWPSKSTHVDNTCDYLHALSCFTPDTWHSGHKDFLLTDAVFAESFPDMACWPWPPQCAIPTGPEAFIFPLSPTWFMLDAFQGSRALMPHSVLVWSTTTGFHDITMWPLRAVSEGCIMLSKHILCCFLVFY